MGGFGSGPYSPGLMLKELNKAILSKLIDRIEILEEKRVAVHYRFKKPDVIE